MTDEKREQRVIKFRVWNDRYKEFNYWGFLEHGFTSIPTGSGIDIESCHKLSQRFTGLHDKYGKDIYEGDVMRHPEFKTNGAIEFIEGCFRFAGWDCVRTDITKGEVIGHIYESSPLNIK